jgi:hypothetical protein
MASFTPISIAISHRGNTYTLSLLADSTFAALQAKLEELTSVPPSMQKLLYKGKKHSHGPDDITLLQAGLKDGMKVQMLGSTVQEVNGVKAAVDEQKRKDQILRERALKAPTKVSNLRLLEVYDFLTLPWKGTFNRICKSCFHSVHFPKASTSESFTKSIFSLSSS